VGLLGVVVWGIWQVTDDVRTLTLFFQYPQALLLVGLAGTEAYYARLAWQQFQPGEPLRSAWWWISAAAACHLAEAIIVQALSQPSYLNPLWITGVLPDRWTPLVRQLGLMIGGSIRMILLMVGLTLVVRLYRRSGLLSKLSAIDWALVAVFLGISLRASWETLHGLPPGRPTAQEAFGWTSIPLLNVLLAQAVLIRRSVLNMGFGLIARCWSAFAAGIVLTAIGGSGFWMSNLGVVRWDQISVVWFIWMPVAAAFALGPVFQVEASRRARGES
jgi:hypothetical protein